jgi:hypothetical protein
MITIKRVETKTDWDAFIELPWKIYKNDPFWVPPLRTSVRDTLDVNKNPFFRHAYMHAVIALRGEEVVGRVIGLIDDAHNKQQKEACVFFGFFECINDPKVAAALFADVTNWGKSRGMLQMRGPVHPSVQGERGLLIKGFKDSPAVLMAYNPSYYGSLLENWGLLKDQDLYAYKIDGREAKFADPLLAQAEKLKQGGTFKIRNVNLSDYENEVSKIFDIYNDTVEINSRFVPMSAEEFRYMAKTMKWMLDTHLLLMVEARGEPIGFALALPDVNQVIKKLKNGKLFPTGLFQLLWNLKGPGKPKTLNRCRILSIRIKKAYREFGIEPLLYTEYLKRAPASGYPIGEASGIAEDDIPLQQTLAQMSGERTKVYRLYHRAIS